MSDAAMDGYQRYVLPAQRDGARARLLTERERIAYVIDDRERLRATALSTMTAQISLLEDALHALTHGSTAVTEEYLDRAISALTAGRDEIREA